VTRSIPLGEVRPLGDRAFLIGVEDADHGRALMAELAPALREVVQSDAQNCELVGGLATVMVLCRDPDATALVLTVLRDGVGRFSKESHWSAAAGGSLITLECAFDGEDLDDVAQMARMSPTEVIALLTTQPLAVSVLGFSPGFAFLSGLPQSLRAIPRRERPRPVVAAGSLALANGHAAVYPSASPGGWQLVGRTAAPLFSPHAAPHSLLAPGDRVQLVAVAPDEVAGPLPWSAPEWVPPDGMSQCFTVQAPGLRTVLQDGGRRGVASLGVPEAGPADPDSLALANRLVGNVPGAPALECLVQGPTLRVDTETLVAVVGARPEVRLDSQPMAIGRVVPVRRGQTLSIGTTDAGLHTYVARAGGFVGPEVLGSVSTDQLSGLGGGALRSGDVLFGGTMTPPLGDHLSERVEAQRADGTLELRVVAGPHAEWFSHDALTRLEAAAFRAEPQSNRVGLRLRAESGALDLQPDLARQHQLDSQGMVRGAVQLPPDGHPVVLRADHATHGGYPVLAVVIAADLGALGQCAPGDSVRLRVVTLPEAEEASALHRRELEGAVRGHYPLAAG
jgi:KipI family sensor histidine kinase inhibitor